MKLWALLAIAPVAACALDTGDGTIRPDINTQAAYREFLKRDHPAVFALAENGKTWAYQYCEAAGACDAVAARANALRSCQRSANDTPCRIYYEAPHGVVWDGPPVVGLDPMTDPESPILKEVEKLDPAPSAQD